MTSINPINIIRLLIITFEIMNNNETFNNKREINLHDVIEDLFIKS